MTTLQLDSAIKKIADSIVKHFTHEKCQYASTLQAPNTDVHGFEELLPMGKWMEFARAEKIFGLLQISSSILMESLKRFDVFTDGIPNTRLIEQGYFKVRIIVKTVTGDFAIANPPVVLVSLDGLRYMYKLADLYLKESVYRSDDLVIPLVHKIIDFLELNYKFRFNEKSGFLEGKAVGKINFIPVTTSDCYRLANEMFRAGISCDRNLLEIVLLSAYTVGADSKAFTFNSFYGAETFCDRTYHPFLKQKG